MQRLLEQLFSRTGFHQLPQVHHRDIMGNVPHHGHIVGNEHIGQPLLLLQIHQKVQDLGLNGNIQSGYGFIADNELRI